MYKKVQKPNLIYNILQLILKLPTMTEEDHLLLYPDPAAKLVQVQAILDAYDLLVPVIITKGAIKEYSLDDGQIKIQREYGSLKEIAEGRLAYEQLANRLIAQMDGRTTKFLPC
jgi:hypothetical protein